MHWLVGLFTERSSVATSLLILALVAASGLAFGSLRIRGIGLGVAGVLFAGLVFGHFGLSIDPKVLDFTRELGLVLFVYAIGLHVGPGFISALKAQGLKLNLLAAGIVVLGVVFTIVLAQMAGIAFPIAVGMFSGATTNTPSLAAAGQALIEHPISVQAAYHALGQVSPDQLAQLPPLHDLTVAQAQKLQADATKLPGLGYAVAYPFGVVGVILSMVLLRALFRIDVAKEDAAKLAEESQTASRLQTVNLLVTNPNLERLKLKDIPAIHDLHVAVSRVLHRDSLLVAQPDTPISVGDILLAVGAPEGLEQLRIIVGELSDQDLRSIPTPIASKRLVVTNKAVVGQRVDELQIQRLGAQITRVRRAGVELVPSDELHLQYADQILVVGLPAAIEKVGRLVGDSKSRLERPEVAPLFVGMALGVIVGSIPLMAPGMPGPVKLGLAGGPLLVAIFMSHVGKIGPIVTYLPSSAGFMLRELGIVLFLACVGLKSGDRFVATLTRGDGLLWMGLAAVITVGPPLLVAAGARIFQKLPYPTLVGLLAGSMTDPPALAFANATTRSQAAAMAYATVYPLTMILRIVAAQLMVLLFV